MTFLRTTILATAAAALCCCITNLYASQPSSQAGTAQKAPDNSNQNKNQNPTADNQSNAQSDRMTTAKIRKAITADKTLSTYAHNVKIITLNGGRNPRGTGDIGRGEAEDCRHGGQHRVGEQSN
jgi:hyperosmotically inducible protein